MYKNIKKVFTGLAYAQLILSIVSLIAMIAQCIDNDFDEIAIIFLASAVVLFFSSCFTYGFGILIDNSNKIVKSLEAKQGLFQANQDKGAISNELPEL